eukprot:12349080-Ditylum_brightwellii.AAC.1
MGKKEKVQLDLVPQACGFSIGNHANLKFNVEYDTPPTTQRSVKVSVRNKYVANNSTVSPFVGVNGYVSVKQVANPYITSAKYESPTKKCLSYIVPTATATKPTAIARPVINDIVYSTPTHYTSTQSITSSEFSPISTPQFSILCNPLTHTPSFNPIIPMQPLALRSEVFPRESCYLPYFHVRAHNTLIPEYRCIDNKVALKDPTPARVPFKNK